MAEVAPAAVVAAVVSGGTSYLVARTTTRSTAGVEREKLAHARREKAVAHVLALNEQMEIVGNAEIAEEVRRNAAQQAHTALVAVHLMLQIDAGESASVNGLLSLLRARDFDGASATWSGIRDSINAGRLPSP